MSEFPEVADIETSSDDYASRFAGPAGTWMLEVQRDAAFRLMGDLRAGTILDVGGGHGQLARPLCEKGTDITILGSDPVCEHRIQDLTQTGSCRFVTGNVIDLPFPDNAFHTVLCFRLVCHCDAWPDLIRELCRVASHRVIIDYPTSQSINALTGMLFGMKKRVEGNTRTYTLFRKKEIVGSFQKQGWKSEGLIKQFFWPMVIHRMLNRPVASKILEGPARILGLTRLLGSPVIHSFCP